MLDRILFALTFASAIGSFMIAGAFFAFSNFVMAALGRIAEAEGIAAMKSINVTVINPVFMIALFGTCIPCLVIGGGALLNWGQPGQIYILAAALLYVIGCAAARGRRT